MTMSKTAALPALLALLLTGCWTTRVTTAGHTARHSAPEQTSRQLFGLWGLVPLTPAAECRGTLVASRSGMDTTDVLIQIGLSVASSLAGSQWCDGDAACLTAAGLGGSLIGTRTVRYRCLPD